MLPTNTAIVYHDPRLLSYSCLPPFSPGQHYPEYPFPHARTVAPNPVYEAVRRFLRSADLDPGNFNTPKWNPLGEIVHPGNRVVIKPNLVMHENHNGGSLDCVITHASLIRAVLDYVLIALDGNGEVIVGDAPLQSADFNRICAAGLNDIMAFYGQHAKVPIKLVDFRIERAQVDRQRLVVRVKETAGDPYGYAAVDFATRSMLAPIAGSFERYRVSDYDPERMREHHNL